MWARPCPPQCKGIWQQMTLLQDQELCLAGQCTDAQTRQRADSAQSRYSKMSQHPMNMSTWQASCNNGAHTSILRSSPHTSHQSWSTVAQGRGRHARQGCQSHPASHRAPAQQPRCLAGQSRERADWVSSDCHGQALNDAHAHLVWVALPEYHGASLLQHWCACKRRPVLSSAGCLHACMPVALPQHA